MSLRNVKPWGIVIYCIPALWAGFWASQTETLVDVALFVGCGLPLGAFLGGVCGWIVSKWFTYPTDEFVPPITKW